MAVNPVRWLSEGGAHHAEMHHVRRLPQLRQLPLASALAMHSIPFER
jgi:hypothetical protein